VVSLFFGGPASIFVEPIVKPAVQTYRDYYPAAPAPDVVGGGPPIPGAGVLASEPALASAAVSAAEGGEASRCALARPRQVRGSVLRAASEARQSVGWRTTCVRGPWPQATCR
jgi:hypothetical protein